MVSVSGIRINNFRRKSVCGRTHGTGERVGRTGSHGFVFFANFGTLALPVGRPPASCVFAGPAFFLRLSVYARLRCLARRILSTRNQSILSCRLSLAGDHVWTVSVPYSVCISSDYGRRILILERHSLKRWMIHVKT